MLVNNNVTKIFLEAELERLASDWQGWVQELATAYTGVMEEAAADEKAAKKALPQFRAAIQHTEVVTKNLHRVREAVRLLDEAYCEEG